MPSPSPRYFPPSTSGISRHGKAHHADRPSGVDLAPYRTTGAAFTYQSFPRRRTSVHRGPVTQLSPAAAPTGRPDASLPYRHPVNACTARGPRRGDPPSAVPHGNSRSTGGTAARCRLATTAPEHHPGIEARPRQQPAGAGQGRQQRRRPATAGEGRATPSNTRQCRPPAGDRRPGRQLRRGWQRRRPPVIDGRAGKPGRQLRPAVPDRAGRRTPSRRNQTDSTASALARRRRKTEQPWKSR